jgi:hypothetical protein
MFSYRSESSFSSVGSIKSSFSQAQLGREKGMPQPEDTSSFMGLNLDGKKEFEPSPVNIEDHETADATCPGEANTPVVTAGQVKTAQVTQPDEMNQPAISSEPAKVTDPAEVVDSQEDNRSEPAETNQPAGSTAQAKVNDSGEGVDPKEGNKSEAPAGAFDWLWPPCFAAVEMAPVLSSLPRQEKAAVEDEKMTLRTQTNYHRDPGIDLAIKDIRASIAAKQKKSTSSDSRGFDEPETIDALNSMGDTRNDDETAKSSFSERKASSSLSPSIYDIMSTLEKSLFGECTVAKSTLRGFEESSNMDDGYEALMDELASSSSGDVSASAGSLSMTTDGSSLIGTGSWGVSSVFDLPKMHDGVSSASVCSSKKKSLLKASRSHVADDPTLKDKKTYEQSMKEAEESIKCAEEALAVLKEHAQRLGNKEQDLLLKGSRSRGTGNLRSKRRNGQKVSRLKNPSRARKKRLQFSKNTLKASAIRSKTCC